MQTEHPKELIPRIFENRSNKQRDHIGRVKIIFAATAAILVVIVIGFVLWASNAAGPMPEAIRALESDQFVHVTADEWYVFDPVDLEVNTGLIFYPGGRVDPRSYAPMARLIAVHGFKVVIVPMPLNLAVFGASKADQVIAAFPEITHWVIGGHSLGGAMAANYAKSRQEKVGGLLLWASYPATSDDLSSSPLEVTSVYASQDGLATPEKVQASRPLLPPNTNWVVIEGGNHAQFGWYGSQSGDRPAEISRDQQQAEVVEGSLGLLFAVSGENPIPTEIGILLPRFLPIRAFYSVFL